MQGNIAGIPAQFQWPRLRISYARDREADSGRDSWRGPRSGRSSITSTARRRREEHRAPRRTPSGTTAPIARRPMRAAAQHERRAWPPVDAAEHDGAEHRDDDGAAELAEERQRAGRDAELVRRHRVLNDRRGGGYIGPTPAPTSASSAQLRAATSPPAPDRKHRHRRDADRQRRHRHALIVLEPRHQPSGEQRADAWRRHEGDQRGARGAGGMPSTSSM